MQQNRRKPSKVLDVALSVAGNVLAGLILFYVIKLLT
jgi:hypothetical protein